MVDFRPFFSKGDNLYEFLIAFLCTQPHLEMGFSLQGQIALQEPFFPYRFGPTDKVGKNIFDKVTSLAEVSISLKTPVNNISIKRFALNFLDLYPTSDI